MAVPPSTEGFLMPNGMNLLPTDPAWFQRVDELAKAAATELGCGVVMVAVQPEGKICVATFWPDGVNGEQFMANGLPSFLLTVAKATAMAEMVDMAERKQAKGSPQ